MSIQEDIKSQITQAMRDKDSVRLTVLRGLSAAFTNELVAKKRKPDEELSDDDALSVISRAVKQRKDSIEQFEKGGRQDLADSERAELTVLEAFLPPQMSREEIDTYVKQKQVELGITDATRKNQLMGMVMKDLKGKADGNLVKELVDQIFA
jgi:uncharacterized protein YqeY